MEYIEIIHTICTSAALVAVVYGLSLLKKALKQYSAKLSGCHRQYTE